MRIPFGKRLLVCLEPCCIPLPLTSVFSTELILRLLRYYLQLEVARDSIEGASLVESNSYNHPSLLPIPYKRAFCSDYATHRVA